jgi:hypothetical protein
MGFNIKEKLKFNNLWTISSKKTIAAFNLL